MAYVLGMTTFPDDLRYTETHEWVRGREKLVTVGITHVAAERLGPIGFVELPYPGELFKAGKVICRMSGESASAPILLPLTVKVMDVNRALDGGAGRINDDPYGAGWIMRVEPGDMAEVEALMDAEAYEAFVAADE